MEWNPQELPVDVLDARIARLRAEMKRAGLDAFIVYTNNVRPSAVAHLTGVTPYWNEGLLLVPASGRLVFATALSNRVVDWIRSTNPFFFSSRRRHTRSLCDWSSDVCSSDLPGRACRTSRRTRGPCAPG